MSNFLHLGRKVAATVATAATFVATQVATLFPQSSNTVATQHGTLSSQLSRLKTFFYSRFGSSSSSTSPNFAQEIEKEGLNDVDLASIEDAPWVDMSRFPDSHDLPDEFDHEDFDEWYEDHMHEYDDHRFDDILRKSWIGRAVDEAIEEENSGTLGDIPF